MSKPTLTVCLIAYNQAGYIRQAVDSLLMQKTDFAWELLIADDCSTDGTREILLEYQKQHPKLIKLILQKKNVGPERNWLDLMARPKSKYVLYAEGDDYITAPNKFQIQVDFLESHPDFSLCFHPVKIIYDDGSKPDEIFPAAERRFNKTVLGLGDLLQDNFMQANSVMYRWRFVDENIGEVFPKNVSPGDWLLHILHAEKGKVGFINQTMAVYRKHPGGIWWNPGNNLDEIWKKYGLSHMALHADLLKRYGKTPTYRQNIQTRINNMLNDFIEVDAKYNDQHLLLSVLRQFPDVVEPFIIELHSELKTKNAELASQPQPVEATKSPRRRQLRHRITRLTGRGVL